MVGLLGRMFSQPNNSVYVCVCILLFMIIVWMCGMCRNINFVYTYYALDVCEHSDTVTTKTAATTEFSSSFFLLLLLRICIIADAVAFSCIRTIGASRLSKRFFSIGNGKSCLKSPCVLWRSHCFVCVTFHFVSSIAQIDSHPSVTSQSINQAVAVDIIKSLVYRVHLVSSYRKKHSM